MTWVVGLIIIAVLLFILYIAAYNGLIKLRNMAEEAFSTMDVYLKKRYDLIPNLVETVKGYAKHESETLEKVVAARNAAYNASGDEQRLKAENTLSQTLRSLFAVAESYPDLKANQNFSNLMEQLKRVEEDIANSRKYYNAVIKTFNTRIETIPTNIVASISHFEKKPLFVIDEQDRENVSVKF